MPDGLHPPSLANASLQPLGRTAAWGMCMLVCMSMTQVFDAPMHDSDSRLYAAMAQDLAARPPASWCAPEWNGHWQRQGVFYEHPPGLLWAGAALIRAGMPAQQALYTCNFVALFAGMAFLYALGRALEKKGHSSPLGLTAVTLWVMTPAFLQYLVRGNQEHPLNLAVLAGLYALVAPMAPVQTAALWAAALVGGMAVKGIAVLALLPIAAVYLIWRDRTRSRCWAVSQGCVVAALAAVAYDLWFQKIAGTSFWAHYLAGQVHHSVGSGGLGHKISNLIYYSARPLWFGWPALALLLVRAAQPQDKLRISAGVGLGALVTLVFVAGFSLANRKADRYIFPIYPALALAAADVALQDPRWRARVARWQPYLPRVGRFLLPMAVALKIYIGTHHHRYIRIWPGG